MRHIYYALDDNTDYRNQVTGKDLVTSTTMTYDEFNKRRNKNTVAVERFHGSTYKLKHLVFGGPCEYIVLWYKHGRTEPDRHYLGTFNNESDALAALHKFQKSHKDNDYKKRRLKRCDTDINETVANTLADTLATYYEDYNIRYCENDDWKNDDLISGMAKALAESDATCDYPLGMVQRLAAALQRRNVKVDESLLKALARDFAQFVIDGGDSNE